MNIFYLSKDTRQCASEHCDKHIVKMVIEYAQLLSTAHRVIDGTEYYGTTSNGRKIKRWMLPDEREKVLYKASHVNHPSAVWCRDSLSNYYWLSRLLTDCLDEYTYRYHKIHIIRSSKLEWRLKFSPQKIDKLKPFYEPPPAMPNEYKVVNNSIQSYRNYYIGSKVRFARWKSPRLTPEWFALAINKNEVKDIENANLHIS